jgi:hypothetical protein
MGTPRQKIPLADLVKSLSGDSRGLVKALAKERIELEKEIEKSLKAVGKVDGELTRKLHELNQRESAARAAVSRQRGSLAFGSQLRGARMDARDIGGVMEILGGGFSAGNVRDIGGVAEMAAERLAAAGNLKSAAMAGRIAGMAALAGSALGFAGAVVGTAYAGFELGGSIGNLLSGDAAEMQQRAARVGSYQESVWGQRERLGDARTAELLSRGVYRRVGLFGGSMMDADPWAGVELSRELNGRSGNEAFGRALSGYEKNLGFFGQAGRGWSRISDAIWGTQSAEQEDATAVAERMNQILTREQKTRNAKKKAWGRSPEGIRTRALQNQRVLALRKIEEQRWSGVRDWSL